MIPHHSDDAQPSRAVLEGLYALPAAGGLAWLPREIPGACWQCRHCRHVYPAATPGVLDFWAAHHPSVCPSREGAGRG